MYASDRSVSNTTIDNAGFDVSKYVNPDGSYIENNPPGWGQRVDLSIGSPYYRQNPITGATGTWLVCCVGITIWAAVVTRKSKSAPITSAIIKRKTFWAAMPCFLVTYTFCFADDIVNMIANSVPRFYFAVQFFFDAVGQIGSIFLLWTIYILLLHLMQHSPLGDNKVAYLHFWRFAYVRGIFCYALGFLVPIMLALRVACLSDQIFDAGSDKDLGVRAAAEGFCLLFDWLYAFAALEVLIMSCVLLARRARQAGSYSKAAHVLNLLLIANPFFLAALFTLSSDMILPPPQPQLLLGTGYRCSASGCLDVDRMTVELLAMISSGLGVVLPLAAIVAVSKRMDSTMNGGERLGSTDIVLVDRDPAATHPKPEIYGA